MHGTKLEKVKSYCISFLWLARINAYINMISIHLYKPGAIHMCEPSSRAKWAPPPEGMELVNVDATIFQSMRQMGTGIVTLLPAVGDLPL
jgi:hypothetical protein